MTRAERSFTPFLRVVVPVSAGQVPETALSLARCLGGRVQLIGLVSVPEEKSLTAATGAVRALRKQLEGLRTHLPFSTQSRVIVSQHAWDDLTRALASEPPDLLVLEWPEHFGILNLTIASVLANPPCPVALTRGPWPTAIQRVLVPVRGGPNAELALRLALALPHNDLVALHVSRPDAAPAVDAPFRGLQRVLPSLAGVTFQVATSVSPAETILEQAREANLLLLGASSGPAGSASGAFVERMLTQAPGALVVLSAGRPQPAQWTGPEGERAGAQAISLLVDRWFAENTFHADEFDDLARLVRLKREQGVTISLALPALNEEETVGEVIRTVREALQSSFPLLDEIVLMDSNSSDRTREIASAQGIPVHIHQEVLPAYGPRSGKGEALWKSLMVTHGDILIWIDTDIVNIDPRFVYGVIGPLLLNPALQFVKGFYQRPLRTGDLVQAGAGGRVTELTARPLINLFFPELSGVIQPLSGEYGGRRTALEQCSFFSGYGVEIGLLIDMFEKFGLAAIAQVDLLERVHHNQSLEALSKMSFTILQAVMHKLEHRFDRAFLEEVNKTMKLIHFDEGNYFLEVEDVVERERPPMAEIQEYCLEHKCTLLPGSASPLITDH
ncbi:MAG: glucosyl-3-phosphoglycerate synthase [Anaerolineaceae bacterium]|nr:glucosyl-3-phosphoglycerate synthase [Anaerolineaceae bacterium]